MLLRLFPNAHVPTVLLNVSLPALPDALPTPANWDGQLHRIASDELLELPRSLYALDQSAWLTEIIQEVTFDMVTLTIGVTFSDGRVEEWPLMDSQCMDVLEGLVEDLQPSEAPKEKERLVASPPVPIPGPSPSSKKSVKHKKQRSWANALASLSSLISLNAQTQASPPPPAPPPPLPPVEESCPATPETLVESATDSLFASRALRNRARSGLVDAYRRFVVSELKLRLPQAGYSVWVAEGQLRNTVEYMSFMVDQAGGVPPDPQQYGPLCQERGAFSSPRTICGPSPYFDEEEADWRSLTDTISTDTDGSSLHTPVSTPAGTQVFRGEVSSAPLVVGGYSLTDLETYARFARQALDLQQSLARLQASVRNVAHEERQFLTVLEIRSKRRAWLNRRYRGGAHMADLGFASPTRSSPLARCTPINADAFCASASSSDAGVSAYYLSVQTADYDTARLFPVTEESDEEDLESGLFFSANPDNDDDDVYRGHEEDEERAALPLERPKIRVRTHSMHRLQALDLDPALAPEPPVLIVPPPPAAASARAALPAFLAPLPKPAAGRGPLFDHGVNLAGSVGETEFTLAMDVPYAPRELEGKGVYEHDDWLPGVVVG
ncbi:hypothetical protein FA95DRAFT_1571206 [Auriscalpium vulgare]|uniref:Uncharacterized protein n=1 Tax=Auriscalpium vulgare TaxID=40419 RepID=A0ACB8S0A7_9AGAM|nr:hypothetical protein FA95DRAFT_1571206 [Auriscalpium vulgare]